MKMRFAKLIYGHPVLVRGPPSATVNCVVKLAGMDGRPLIRDANKCKWRELSTSIVVNLSGGFVWISRSKTGSALYGTNFRCYVSLPISCFVCGTAALMLQRITVQCCQFNTVTEAAKWKIN